MKILFDHQAFSMQRYGGISRCFIELYKHFPESIQAEFALRECNNAYIREENLAADINTDLERWILPFIWKYKETMFNTYQQLKGYNRYVYWDKTKYNQIESIRLLNKGDFDIFHPTFFDDYFVQFLNGKPFVLTIHDMIPELYPQYFDSEKNGQIIGKRKLAPLASAIIAVSEKTKEDVIRILGVPDEKVHVVYHGCSFPMVEHTLSIYNFPYILYVGDRNIYKNFDLFVHEVTKNLIRHPELKVVCTGRAFNSRELSMLEDLGITDRFLQHWVKTDDEFYSLYHHAACFVYPSEYEGFGIPILEAYKADCPVLLNHASCFPEIAGEAAIYFTLTKDESNLAEVLENFLAMDDAQIDSLKQKQRERLNLYSWEKSALQLAKVYESVLAKS